MKKELLLDVYCSDEYTPVEGNENTFTGEAQVRIKLGSLKIARIKAMAAICSLHDFANIADYCHYPIWEELSINGEAVRADVAQMHVSKEKMWVDCYVKHTTIKLTSEPVEIKYL